MKNIVGARLQKFSGPGALGIVQNTRYIRCFWPHARSPVAPFADGSGGIQIMGPPTPRNIVFPPDTVFLDRIPNAEAAAEKAVQEAHGGTRRIINLTDGMSDIYWETLNAVGGKPRNSIGRERFYLEEIGEPTEREPKGARFITLLTDSEADDLVSGKITDAALRRQKTFRDRNGATLSRVGLDERVR